jgi:hypothetical protein
MKKSSFFFVHVKIGNFFLKDQGIYERIFPFYFFLVVARMQKFTTKNKQIKAALI